MKFASLLFSAQLLLPLISNAQLSATAIATGDAHSLFLKSDGSLWAMGLNVDPNTGNLGWLGDGTINIFTNVTEMIVASNVTAVAAGDEHSLFLKSDGSLWAMGNNSAGQLGDGGAYDYINVPEEIVSNGVTAIAAGGNHSLFIKKHGAFPHNVTELWAMGDNSYGQLGDGTTYSRSAPVLIQSYTANSTGGGAPVTAIAAGFSHSLFLKSDGSLWAMGQNAKVFQVIATDYSTNYFGQLGDGNYLNTNLPVMIVASNVTAIAAGYEHSLFLKTDGSLWGMGGNPFGALGGSITITNVPTLIVASHVIKIAAGYYHSLFIKDDSSLWGMGWNRFGQLGGGTPISAIVASGVTDVCGGGEHTLFLASGSLWGIGCNIYGQLGDHTTNNAYLPEMIFGPPPLLAIMLYGNSPVLFYPTALGVNEVLQISTNLPSGNWMAATNGVSFTAVQVTNAPANAVFRLY